MGIILCEQAKRKPAQWRAREIFNLRQVSTPWVPLFHLENRTFRTAQSRGQKRRWPTSGRRSLAARTRFRDRSDKSWLVLQPLG